MFTTVFFFLPKTKYDGLCLILTLIFRPFLWQLYDIVVRFLLIRIYSCPNRLDPTYILPATEIRRLRRFPSVSFKSERKVCVESD